MLKGQATLVYRTSRSPKQLKRVSSKPGAGQTTVSCGVAGLYQREHPARSPIDFPSDDPPPPPTSGFLFSTSLTIAADLGIATYSPPRVRLIIHRNALGSLVLLFCRRLNGWFYRDRRGTQQTSATRALVGGLVSRRTRDSKHTIATDLKGPFVKFCLAKSEARSCVLSDAASATQAWLSHAPPLWSS